MAASSQYHRGAAAAATASAHYRPLPGDHEHMYVNLATSWHSHSPHGLSRAPFHYLDYAGPGDYVHHLPSQPAWAANYLRPVPHDWANSLNDGNHTARPLPCVGIEARAPVPHTSPPARQHQDATDAAHIAPFDVPGPVYRSDAHQHGHQHTSEHAGAPTAPPFPPHAPQLAPVARLLNCPNPGLHVSPPHEPSHSVVSWPAGSSSGALEYPTQHASTTLSSDVVLAGQGHLSSSAWGMLDADTSVAPPVYEQVQHADPQWPSVRTLQLQQHDFGPQVSLAVAAPRAVRKPAPKKSLARVPAAFVQRQPKVKVSKRKGPLDEASRQKTHRMRKEKATCLRCRFYKAGCDEGDPCKRCSHIEGNARSFRLPCIRDRLEDANLVRHCNGRSNQEEGEFFGYDWLQGGLFYTMEISWNLPMYGPISNDAAPMAVTFREYYPNRQQLDTTVSVWRNSEGDVKKVEQPAYAIYDTANFKTTFDIYFSRMQLAMEAWIFNRVRDDEIAVLTYNEVMRVRRLSPSGSSNLLDIVMRIQCLSVVSQGYGTIVTNGIPGVKEYDYGQMGRSEYEAYDRTSRHRPLPNAMNHQIDVAALKCLKKLEKTCVRELRKRIFGSKIKPWYEVFLAFYVLLWNMEYIRHGAAGYMKAKNGTDVHQQVSSVVNNQLKKWDWAFNILIYHWMAVLRDFHPFKLARENPEELRVNGHIDAEGFEYVMKVVRIYTQLNFGRSTAPYIGQPPTHDSLSSEWIKTLLNKAFGL